MKNIQVIDGADNAAYDIYSCTEEEFHAIFPAVDQNIEFIEDMVVRLGAESAGKLLEPIWKRPIKKEEVAGIHGTLFYELAEEKRAFYPNKREADLDSNFSRSWVHG